MSSKATIGNWCLRAIAAVLLLIFLLPFYYYSAIARLGARIDLRPLDVALEAISAGVAVWALLEYRRSAKTARRWVFLCTALGLLVVWAAELVSWASGGMSPVLRSLVTSLNYTWAILVCASLWVFATSRRGSGTG